MSQFKWLSLIFLLILSLALVQGQGAGSDDSSSSDTQDAQDAPPPSDPNLLGPTNKQGYGRNVQTTLKKSETQAMKVSPSDATIGEQTIQAALQFGVLVIFLVYQLLSRAVVGAFGCFWFYGATQKQ